MKIATKSAERSSGYRLLIGHDCFTEEEMRTYVATLDPKGRQFKLVDDDFDFGASVTPPPAPSPVEVMSEGRRRAVSAVLEAFSKPLPTDYAQKRKVDWDLFCAIRSADLEEIAGLDNGGYLGFSSQTLSYDFDSPVATPKGFTDLEAEGFRLGSEIARDWMRAQKAFEVARREAEAEGSSGLRSHVDLEDEHKETLRDVMRRRALADNPEAEGPSGPSL